MPSMSRLMAIFVLSIANLDWTQGQFPGFPWSLTPKTGGSAVPSMKICGNYCGRGWCGGQIVSENSCDFTVASEADSCPDSCCKNHDRCCSSSDTAGCNRAIVDCLSHCGPLDMSCTNGFVPVLAGAIQNTMDLVEDWCCDRPCLEQLAAYGNTTSSQESDFAAKSNMHIIFS
mmetsp:Transcript_75463/g.157373  ORF Transcript_75463/g.157373 Transcript_75463/m.157373 type:complete len:173 (-) Transcript_75463:310-828(-)